MTEIALPTSHWKWTPVLAFLSAVALALGLFLLVPLTQFFEVETEVVTFREMQLITAAPPRTPPAEEQQEIKQEEKPPELQKEFQNLSLQQLELSLNPGIGDAFAMGAGSMALEQEEIDVMEEAERIFQFSELSNVPRIISSPRFDFPRSLIRQGIREGKVIMLIEIDEKGKVTVLDIVSSSHSELSKLGRNIVERSPFTISKIEGKAVKVRGQFPLNLRAPKRK